MINDIYPEHCILAEDTCLYFKAFFLYYMRTVLSRDQKLLKRNNMKTYVLMSMKCNFNLGYNFFFVVNENLIWYFGISSKLFINEKLFGFYKTIVANNIGILNSSSFTVCVMPVSTIYIDVYIFFCFELWVL